MNEREPTGRGELTLRADTAELAKLEAFTKEILGGVSELDDDVVRRVDLVVTELFVNAIRHGGATSMHVTMGYVEGAVAVTCRDDGRRFDPRSVALDEPGILRAGGYGLMVIRRLADDISYAYDRGHNRVELSIPARR